MSYILDALRKSEAERRQQQAPGLASLPGGGRSRRGGGRAWLLGGLLLVNAVVLTALLLREPAPQTAAAPVTAAPIERPSARFSEVVRDAREATPVTPAATAPAPASDDPGTAVRRDEPPPRTTPVESAPSEPEPAQVAALPTLMELRAGGDFSVPQLHLDIHVYSETASQRFVFINMSKYRENEALAEGPTVDEIRSDGVVLRHRGRAFLLPRE